MNTINEPVTGHRTQIYLPESLYRLIIDKAQKEDVSMAQMIRKIIEKSIIKKERQMKKSNKKAWDNLFELAGIGNSGYKNISTDHDKYIGDNLYTEHQKETRRLRRRSR